MLPDFEYDIQKFYLEEQRRDAELIRRVRAAQSSNTRARHSQRAFTFRLRAAMALAILGLTLLGARVAEPVLAHFAPTHITQVSASGNHSG